MNRTLWAFILLVLLMLLLTACGADPLDGTSWMLVTYSGTVPIEGTTITAVFEDGEVRGSGGCNTYFGTYQVKGDEITFEDVMYTAMGCLDPEGAMEQETEIMSFFRDAERFEFDGDRLMIYRTGGEALIFDPQ